LRPYLSLLVLPILLISADLIFRAEHLERYKNEQLVFYVFSVFVSIGFWTWLTLFLRKIQSFFPRIVLLSVFFPIFLIFTVGSFSFFSLNGLFPNYYTLLYFKTEPESAFLIVKDSLSWSAIIGFILVWTLGVYLISQYYFPRLPLLARKTLFASGAFVFLSFQALLLFHKKFDQCAIVDTNMAMCIQRHLLTWDDLNEFKGTGLGVHQPFQTSIKGDQLPYNVVIFVLESVRKNSLQVYGNEVETTPRLAEFKARHKNDFYQFETAVTASTTTMLAVPSVLTGIAPYQDSAILYTQPFLWDFGKTYGHQTFFLSSHTLKWYDFDRFYSKEKLDVWWNKDNSGLPYFNDLGVKDGHTIEKLKSTVSTFGEKPFFGVVQLNTTHYPYKVPNAYFKWTETYRDSYHNSVFYQDAIIGDFLDYLESQDLLKNTLLFFVADHGEALMEHRSIGHVESNYAETIRVPMFAHVPQQLLTHQEQYNLRRNQNQLTSGIDIAPTLYDLLDMNQFSRWRRIHKNYTGYSLLDSIPDGRMMMTLNNNQIARFNTGVSVATKDWHYLFRFNIVPHKEEFYNWKNDPSEKKSLKTPLKVKKDIVKMMSRFPAISHLLKKIR
jgi:glucan phosphoethanolaminetransferase (alkaline phosphatase superfamily)